jgi:hypothetical protein
VCRIVRVPPPSWQPPFSPDRTEVFSIGDFCFAHFKRNFSIGVRPERVTRADVCSGGERPCSLRASSIGDLRVRAHVLEGGGHGVRELFLPSPRLVLGIIAAMTRRELRRENEELRDAPGDSAAAARAT